MSNETNNGAVKEKTNAGAFAFQIFCATIFLGMIGMVFVNAVLRYCFNSGYPPSEEWARFLFIYITFFGAIEGFYRHKQIAVEMVVDLLSGMTRKIFAVFALLASMFALYILLEGGVIFVLQEWDTFAIATPVKMWCIYITLPIMAGTSLLLLLVDLVKVLRKPANEFRRPNAEEELAKALEQQ